MLAESLAGKAVLITGAASGIGEQIARFFAPRNANLYLFDKQNDLLNRVAKDLRAQGANVNAYCVDLCDATQVEVAINGIQTEIGGFDVLINNAGADPRRAFVEMDETEWTRVIDINLNSAYRCTRLVIPRMVARHSGKIINISSVTFHHGLSQLTHYIAAKGALVGFTRALAREIGAYNVHVNCITPGAIITNRESEVATPEQIQAVLSLQSLQRRITPLDIARACAFLATDWSDGMTGQTINVDGGWIMH